ncbi:protoheme IX farnesyltransferase [Colletotrichum graminicola]|uniref:Protoheme IX farnesyltransferase, mitochondrial n=1 Tax=Colletotrichum graminicola (strain M1.001 / M2 / FGSC 10212) TaxID=645133 RepID=E3QM48_COLGM|nr:protoheme IX farnesyltransferase [Colletotrichum graminicola M1.001]EFQ31936.1 protoheme IX farnesyltransferase [Colletotrichum graminicola M1.001]WDK21822.1 protoheme IX farnesyltransferase [Colletotrichum graminicola]
MRPAPSTLLRPYRLDNLCRQCIRQASSAPQRGSVLLPLIPRRDTSTTAAKAAPVVRLGASYFLSNSVLERANVRTRPLGSRSSSASAAAPSSSSSTVRSEPTSTPIDVNHELPHRRRQAARRKAAAEASSSFAASPSTPNVLLPQDASSALTTVAARQPAHSARRIFSTLLSLSKPRLSVLVVLTSMATYALYPVPGFLSPAITESPSLSPLTLLFLTTGTALCSASANSLNMLYEPATDAKMSRTRNRPLVRGLLTKRAAVLFAVATAATGVGALYFGVNPTVAFLGGANIVIYAGMYTPMKAFSAANTWLGAVVGGIPPLMGWAAAAGETASGDGSWRELLLASDGSSIGGWLMAGLLFAWQFPHFMALSWSIREEYKAAGLRMLAWTNPARNARVALRYSIAFIPLCVALCAAGVTEWSFAVTSLPVNLWLTREAVRFWKYEGHKGSARGLFWASVWQLPVVMVLALLQKKGMWGRVWDSIMGEDEDEWEDELDEMPVAVPTSRGS